MMAGSARRARLHQRVIPRLHVRSTCTDGNGIAYACKAIIPFGHNSNQCVGWLQSRPTPLKDDHARFYAASVVCGLEYMQDRNLMWRCAMQHRSITTANMHEVNQTIDKVFEEA